MQLKLVAVFMWYPGMEI